MNVRFLERTTHVKEEFPFKNIPSYQWNDWKWQIRNRIYDYNVLCNILGVNPENQPEIKKVVKRYPLAVTPYTVNEMYKMLCSGKKDDFNVLWNIYIPNSIELLSFLDNPIAGTGEEKTTPFNNCYQFFPDRVLIRITSMCPSICRYCFVRHKVKAKGQILSKQEVFEIVEFIKKDKNIKDVIISGGDPLLLSDSYLSFILKTFREIPHVEILRIDSKIPNSLPQRITPKLVKMISQFSPLYLNTHIVHPCEITNDFKIACNLLADNGIVLGAHIPLLKGINDSPEIVERLVIELLKIRVRPYMLIHYIKTDGADHFATSIDKGIEIIEYLWGRVSGLAVPMYVLYLPEGGGKVPIFPNYIVKKEEYYLFIKNYKGEIFKYEIPTI